MILRKKIYSLSAASLLFSAGMLVVNIEKFSVIQVFYFFLFGAIHLCFLIGLIEYFIFFRLSTLDRAMNDIENGSPLKRIVNIYGEDEIASIAESINITFEQFEKHHKELLKRTDLYTSLVEDAPIMVHRFKPDGTTTFVNNFCCDYYKISREEFENTNFFELIKTRGSSGKSLKRRLSTLNPSNPSNTHTYEAPRIGKASEPKWVMWVNRAMFDGNGGVIEYQTIGMDVYDKKSSEGKVRLVINNISDLIYLTDHKGIIEYASPSNESILGSLPESMIDKNILDFVHQKDVDGLAEEMNGCVENKYMSKKEFRLKKNDGSYIWVQSNGNSILNENGDVNRLVFSIRDMGSEKAQKIENMIKELRDSSSIIFFLKEGRELKVEYVSENVKELSYSSEEFMDGFLNYTDIICPESIEKVWAEMDCITKDMSIMESCYKIIDGRGNVVNIKDKTLISRDEKNVATYYKGITIEENSFK